MICSALVLYTVDLKIRIYIGSLEIDSAQYTPFLSCFAIPLNSYAKQWIDCRILPFHCHPIVALHASLRFQSKDTFEKVIEEFIA